jgi:beta-N-acetylhexosaminidase
VTVFPKYGTGRYGAALFLVVCSLFSAVTPAVAGRESASAAASSRAGAAGELGPKMGRLVFTGFLGTTVNDNTRHLLRDVGVGGLIVHSSNIQSRTQALALTRGLRQAVGRQILVAVTQEPGVVDHLNGIFPSLPSPQEQARKNPFASRKVGCRLGKQLASVGIDVDFAPVLDVLGPPDAFIGSRSYGHDPDVVATHGVAFVRGLQQAGVFPVVKHFPGHGGVKEDSHTVLPVDSRRLYQLRRRDLVPFGAAFRAGAPAAMTAHVLYPRIDPDFPASLSREITTGLLQDDLGFDGLVVTDALGMGALRGRSLAQRAVRAVVAGADMVVFSSQPGDIPAVVAALRSAVRTGKIPRKRALEALDHVSAALQRATQLRHAATACPA